MPPKSSRVKKAKALSRSQLAAELAVKVDMPKSKVAGVLESLADLIASELKAGRPVSLQSLIKIAIVHKPATAARPGRNPATGETITIKAKPARKVVKVRALKALKDMV